jgi:succinate dehydrogenase/fumarate reductase flavoprotein subunit
MFKVETKGFKETINKLEKLRKNAENLSGEHIIPFTELFNPEFMMKHTKFLSIEALFEASGFEVNSKEDFEKIPDDEWEKFIVSNTQFSSWEEMQREAATDYAKAKLLQGLKL